MRKPPYGILMQDGHSAELIETLIAKVTEMAERHFKEEANQETSAQIPWIVEEVVAEQVPRQDLTSQMTEDAVTSIVRIATTPRAAPNERLPSLFSTLRNWQMLSARHGRNWYKENFFAI